MLKEVDEALLDRLLSSDNFLPRTLHTRKALYKKVWSVFLESCQKMKYYKSGFWCEEREELGLENKIQDLISATKGVMGEVLAEDAIPKLAEEMLKGTVLEATSGAFSMLSPRIGGIMVAYQQRRWERNWEKYISLIYERQREFNERLEKLDTEMRKKFRYDFFPLVSDFVQSEKQEEKIGLIVNGLTNIAGGINWQEDVVLMFYDTLSQLNLLDLRLLKLYASTYIERDDNDDIYKLMNECQIDNSQAGMIREKLERLGLIQSKNEEKIYENIENVIKYVEDIAKGKKDPKLKRIKNVPKSESYRITSFGLKFIKFFMKSYEIEN